MKKNSYSIAGISVKSIYIFALLILFTFNVYVPAFGGGRNIAVNIAEITIIGECLLLMLLFGLGHARNINVDHTYLVKVKVIAIILCAYIATSRMILFTTGFNFDYLSYPRITITFIAMFFWLVMKQFSSQEKVDAVLIFVTYLNVLELIYFFARGELRSSNILLNINIYVCIIIVILPTLMKVVVATDEKLRLIWCTLILISSLILVMLSGSRAGTVIALVIIVYGVIKEKQHKLIVFLMLLSIPMMVWFFGGEHNFGGQEMIMRSFSLLTGTPNTVSSDNMRNELWNIGLQKIKTNPLLGTGELSFDYQAGTHSIRLGAHNFIIELLMSYGVVGLLIYIAMIYYMIKTNVAYKSHGSVVNITVIGYLMFSFVEPTFVEKIILLVFLLCITSDLKWVKR